METISVNQINKVLDEYYEKYKAGEIDHAYIILWGEEGYGRSSCVSNWVNSKNDHELNLKIYKRINYGSLDGLFVEAIRSNSTKKGFIVATAMTDPSLNPLVEIPKDVYNRCDHYNVKPLVKETLEYQREIIREDVKMRAELIAEEVELMKTGSQKEPDEIEKTIMRISGYANKLEMLQGELEEEKLKLAVIDSLLNSDFVNKEHDAFFPPCKIVEYIDRLIFETQQDEQ